MTQKQNSEVSSRKAQILQDWERCECQIKSQNHVDNIFNIKWIKALHFFFSFRTVNKAFYFQVANVI
jgi:hypothetical protein